MPSAAADAAATSEQLEPQPAWLIIGLTAASLFGAVVGLVAFGDARWQIGVAVLVQLAVTAAGVWAPRWPVLWAVAVAAVGLASVLAHPALSELAYSGGMPWVGLSVAAAALTLYRRAGDRTAILAGSVALALGCSGLVVASVSAGMPVAPAAMATSVYPLLGVLAALSLHLRDARDDRVRRSELTVAIDRAGELASSAPDARDALDAARRALAIVALRSDDLVSSSSDVSARRAAADLRDVAHRGLAGPGEYGGTRIEIRTAASGAAGPDSAGSHEPGRTGRSRTSDPMPDLPDREREILRLVSTGASNAAIARSLYLSEATVKQYVSRLMRRFDRENRTQLALMAARWFDEPGVD